MEKVKVSMMPGSLAPVVIAGALVDGKPNYLTVGAFGLISVSPHIIYISLNRAHYTNPGIIEGGYFSVNIPSRDLVQKTDYVGLVSGIDTDKSGVFTSFYGSVDKAPLIKECPVNHLCKVTEKIIMLNNEVFFGEVMETYVNDTCLTDGGPDPKKIDPIIIAWGSYFGLGNVAGAIFSEGKALIKK